MVIVGLFVACAARLINFFWRQSPSIWTKSLVYLRLHAKNSFAKLLYET